MGSMRLVISCSLIANVSWQEFAVTPVLLESAIHPLLTFGFDPFLTLALQYLIGSNI